ncbi:hypothetical protein [Ferrigenium sp. UT5]|uniref:hypothetical protein n=1 Tax=Ferrigenium sp. UT5 TaxID=3242105 RepID=UPI003550E117
MNEFVKGMVLGNLLVPDQTAQIEADSRAEIAGMQADRAIAIAERKHQELVQAHEARQCWHLYASRLRVNLEARKISEAALLEALMREGINHPLATAEGFEAHFKAELDKQYRIAAQAEEHAKELEILNSIPPLQHHLNKIDAEYLARMPVEIAQLSEDQRRDAMKKANEQVSFGFAKSMPEWVSLEKERLAALAQAERDFDSGSETAESSIAAAPSECPTLYSEYREIAVQSREYAKELEILNSIPPLQHHLNKIDAEYLARMPVEIAQLSEDQRRDAMKKANEQFSFGFAKSMPEWVSLEKERLAALAQAEKDFDSDSIRTDAPIAPRRKLIY